MKKSLTMAEQVSMFDIFGETSNTTSSMILDDIDTSNDDNNEEFLKANVSKKNDQIHEPSEDEPNNDVSAVGRASLLSQTKARKKKGQKKRKEGTQRVKSTSVLESEKTKSIAQKLLMLDANNDTITVRKLFESVKGRYPTVEHLNKQLVLIERKGAIKITKTTKVGRPSRIIHVDSKKISEMITEFSK